MPKNVNAAVKAKGKAIKFGFETPQVQESGLDDYIAAVVYALQATETLL